MEPITVEYLGSQIAETTYLNPKGTLNPSMPRQGAFLRPPVA